LFALLPLVACWRYEPRERLRPLALSRPAVPPSPLSDRVGYSDHVRFRGYVSVHCRSGLQPPCLRFATAVTGRHARLGSRLLARLYRGRHLKRQSSTRFQGATPTKPAQNPTTGQHGSNHGFSCTNSGAGINTPGNAIAAPGSPFNPSGQAGNVYAGNPGTASAVNANSTAAVAQYDVACANQAP
jgi:hypothetical protein